jgi:hypothetical protein
MALLRSLLVVAFVAGCYNPTIGDRLRCNPNYEPNAGQCPDGYHCGGDFCVKGAISADGGVDLGADKGAPHPDAPVEMTPDVALDVPPETPQMCIMPVAGCVADTSKGCDPVCQKGCPVCTEKCSVTAMGVPTCNAPLQTRPRALGEACNISALNSSAQTDDCAPGLVCLNDACNARCYKFCKSDNDCPMSTCSRDAGGGVKVCDVQAVTCNPIKNGMPTGCPADTQGCYLSTTVTDRTVCDCPFQAGGTNSSCTLSRDCFPGLVCVDVLGTGSSVCRPVCSLAVGASDCVGTTCMALKGSKKYGFCN